jgi:hypothetical protein
MYKVKYATVLKTKKVRNDAQGKCAKILKAKCTKMPKAKCEKVRKEKCAKMRVRKKAALVRRPEGKDEHDAL